MTIPSECGLNFILHIDYELMANPKRCLELNILCGFLKDFYVGLFSGVILFYQNQFICLMCARLRKLKINSAYSTNSGGNKLI